MGCEGSGRGGGVGMGGEGPIGRWRERREKLATGQGELGKSVILWGGAYLY